MKRIFTFCALLGMVLTLSAQKGVLKKSYYDYWETVIKNTWYELGDGTRHGLETYFYEGGQTAFTIKWEKGVALETKSFFEDKSPIMVVRRNRDALFHGEQLHYQYIKGTHLIKAKAMIEYDTVRSFEAFKRDGKPYWKYTDDGTTKTYSEYEKGELVSTLSIASNMLSGNIKEKAVFKDNTILSMKESYIDAQLKDTLLYVVNTDNNMETSRVKKYHNPIDYEVEFSAGHPLMGQLFDLHLDVVNYNGREVANNSVQRQYTWYYEILRDQNKITNYLLKQYVIDGHMVEKKGGSMTAEALYDMGEVVWRKEYDGPDGALSYEFKDKTKIWYKNAKLFKLEKSHPTEDYLILIKNYKEGILFKSDSAIYNVEIGSENYDVLSEIKEYNETGVVTGKWWYKGDNRLKFWSYNDNGELTDSDELREQAKYYDGKINKNRDDINDQTDGLLELFSQYSQKAGKDFKHITNALTILNTAFDEEFDALQAQGQSKHYDAIYNNTYKSLIVTGTEDLDSESFSLEFATYADVVEFAIAQTEWHKEVIQIIETHRQKMDFVIALLEKPNIKDISKAVKKAETPVQILAAMGYQ